MGFNICNVASGTGSPNNISLFGLAIAPKDDYETLRSCFNSQFNQLNALDNSEMVFDTPHGPITKKVLM